MLTIFIRTLIIYLTLIIVIRLMGKRQIGEMQPFEFIVTLIIADLACIPMADVSIPLLYGIVSILCLFILHQVLSLLEQSNKLTRMALSGKPSIVIDKNGVNFKELKNNNLGLSDLIESLRSQGYFSFEQLDYAIFESNGKLSCMEKENAQSVNSLPLVIISGGKIDKHNLSIVGDILTLNAFLKEQKSCVKKTLVLTVDGKGKAYFQQKNQKFQVLSFPLKENAKW